MRGFRVVLPSGARYWTVVDDDLAVVTVADAYLRHVRFARDGAELTTKSYAGAIALFLRWCARTGRHWHTGVEHLGLFMTWLRHAPRDSDGGGELAEVMAGPGVAPVRGARRVNVVLSAVRGLVIHAVAAGDAPVRLLPLLYELADDAELPEEARHEDARIAWRLRARHRLHEPDAGIDRAQDEEIVALLKVCLSARDRLLVLLMARAGLRRGEVCGLRRGDVHLSADSRRLGCEVKGAHLHVHRRDNPNASWAKSRHPRVVPLDALVVRAFDTYELERIEHPDALGSDFVLVNLFRAPLGAPMRPDAINELLRACSRRAGLSKPVAPHQLRHAFGSNLADAGGRLDEIAELLGHRSMASSEVYLHPDPARLRRAVDAVPMPRHADGATQ
ncbi:MAG: tyrosine-type recombinase/integrase [Steroidobacteraceae bacterium]